MLNNPGNRSRVFPFHILFIDKQPVVPDWFCRQGQYLEERAVKGQKVLLNQQVPGHDIGVQIKTKTRTDLVVTVE